MNKLLPILATLLVIALIVPATSASSDDISVELISEITLPADVQENIKTISADLIAENVDISGAYKVMAVCVVKARTEANQYRGEIFATVLSATEWCAVTSKISFENLNAEDMSCEVTGVKHNVPPPSTFVYSDGDYAANKGLADTPCGDIPSAVAATKSIHKYFRDALGSSKRLIGKQAKRSPIMNQLKNNKNLIAWSNIGHGSPYGLLMFDGWITSDDFCSMPKWKGLKDCVCFINSCSACLDPLKSCILGGTPPTPDHEVRTYIAGLVPLPIGPSDDTDREFWQHTLLECWGMGAALDEAEDNHGLGGCYCLIGDDGKFFPPLVITTKVKPAPCVAPVDSKLTISAKSNRFVFPDEEVCLDIYDADDDTLVFHKCWTITKKTKTLFIYKWTASVDPGTYRIEVTKEDCDGLDYKWIAIVPKNRKLVFSEPAFEWIRWVWGQANGHVKPTKFHTIKTSWGALGEFSEVPTSSHVSKTYSVSDDNTYNGVTLWTGVITGTYSTSIKNKVVNKYNGKCWIGGYDNQDDWYMDGGSKSHSISLYSQTPGVTGEVLDWTKIKDWTIGYNLRRD